MRPVARVIFAIAAVALLNGCGASGPFSRERQLMDMRERSRPSAAEEAQCLANGGAIQGVGLFGLPACVIPYADAGKTCSDKSDCQGRCMVDLDGTPSGPGPELKLGDPASGRCQKDTNLDGCYAFIVDGKVSQALCGH